MISLLYSIYSMLHTNHDNFTSILMFTSSPYPVHKVNVASRPGLDVFLIPLISDSALRKPLQKFDHMIDINKSQRETKETSLSVVSLCNHTKRTDFVLIGCLHACIMIFTHCQTGSGVNIRLWCTNLKSRSRFP